MATKKVELIFNLNDEDDLADFNRYMKSSDLQSAMWNFSQDVLRKIRKYGPSQELRDLIRKSISSANIDLKTDEKGVLDITDILDLVITEVTDKIEDDFYKYLNDYEVSIED